MFNLQKTNKFGLIIALFVMFSGFFAIQHKIHSVTKQHNELNCSVCIIAKSFNHGQTSVQFKLDKPILQLFDLGFEYQLSSIVSGYFPFNSRAPPVLV